MPSRGQPGPIDVDQVESAKQDDESLKLAKKAGLPEVEGGTKPSTKLLAYLKCLDKKVSACETLKAKFNALGEVTQVQKRLPDNITDLYIHDFQHVHDYVWKWSAPESISLQYQVRKTVSQRWQSISCMESDGLK